MFTVMVRHHLSHIFSFTQIIYNIVFFLCHLAEVDASNGIVNLWLGANVMLEYSYDEAIEFLLQNLDSTQREFELVKEDLAFVRDQIVTSEVSMTRIFNWDVRQKRADGTAVDTTPLSWRHILVFISSLLSKEAYDFVGKDNKSPVYQQLCQSLERLNGTWHFLISPAILFTLHLKILQQSTNHNFILGIAWFASNFFFLAWRRDS